MRVRDALRRELEHPRDSPSLQDVTADELLRLDAESFAPQDVPVVAPVSRLHRGGHDAGRVQSLQAILDSLDQALDQVGVVERDRAYIARLMDSGLRTWLASRGITDV